MLIYAKAKLIDYEKTGKAPDPPNSMGNGCAMRVSPIAYGYKTIHEVERCCGQAFL